MTEGRPNCSCTQDHSSVPVLRAQLEQDSRTEGGGGADGHASFLSLSGDINILLFPFPSFLGRLLRKHPPFSKLLMHVCEQYLRPAVLKVLLHSTSIVKPPRVWRRFLTQMNGPRRRISARLTNNSIGRSQTKSCVEAAFGRSVERRQLVRNKSGWWEVIRCRMDGWMDGWGQCAVNQLGNCSGSKKEEKRGVSPPPLHLI